jgi:hypothetical protein
MANFALSEIKGGGFDYEIDLPFFEFLSSFRLCLCCA